MLPDKCSAPKMSTLYRLSRSDPASRTKQSTSSGKLASQACTTCVEQGPAMSPPVSGCTSCLSANSTALCTDSCCCSRFSLRAAAVARVVCAEPRFWLTSTRHDTRNAALTPVGGPEHLEAGNRDLAEMEFFVLKEHSLSVPVLVHADPARGVKSLDLAATRCCNFFNNFASLRHVALEGEGRRRMAGKSFLHAQALVLARVFKPTMSLVA